MNTESCNHRIRARNKPRSSWQSHHRTHTHTNTHRQILIHLITFDWFFLFFLFGWSCRTLNDWISSAPAIAKYPINACVIIFDVLLIFSLAECRIISTSATNKPQNPQFGTCLLFLPVFDNVAVAFKSRLRCCQGELSLHSTGCLTVAGASIYQMELVCQILELKLRSWWENNKYFQSYL